MEELAMMQALWTASTGMLAQELNTNTISNNLANVNTTGFKKSRVDFQDLMYQILEPAGIKTSMDSTTPTGVFLGEGVKPVATLRMHQQGPLVATGGTFDLAIEGNGFFQVLTPEGEIGYTRDGSFKIDGTGNLLTSDGYYLEPPVTVPLDTSDVVISEDGRVLIEVAGQIDLQEVGQIRLVNFINPSGLRPIGQNLLIATPASGHAVEGEPNQQGFGALAQGFLESSNVTIVEEMVNLIIAQRAYEINTKAIQTSDDMMGLANNLRR
jgi:flagellar basal-body rod protein FlgG